MTWDWTRYSRWSRAIARRRAAAVEKKSVPARERVGLAPNQAALLRRVRPRRVHAPRGVDGGRARRRLLRERVRVSSQADSRRARRARVAGVLDAPRHDAPFAHPDDHESTNPANLPTPSPPIYRPAVDARVFSCATRDVRRTRRGDGDGVRESHDRPGLAVGKLVASASAALERCAMACPARAPRAVHARYGVKPETGAREVFETGGRDTSSASRGSIALCVRVQ